MDLIEIAVLPGSSNLNSQGSALITRLLRAVFLLPEMPLDCPPSAFNLCPPSAPCLNRLLLLRLLTHFSSLSLVPDDLPKLDTKTKWKLRTELRPGMVATSLSSFAAI